MACWGTASSPSVTTPSGAPPARRFSTQSCCWRRGTWEGRDQAPRFVVFTLPGALPGTPLTPATYPPSNRRHHHSALHPNPSEESSHASPVSESLAAGRRHHHHRAVRRVLHLTLDVSPE